MTVAAHIRTFAVAALLAGPVQAQSPIADVICEPTGRMHDKLTLQFGAKQSASGMRGPEQIMEVWTSESGDWTLVITYATGTSCIVAMGEDWFTRADPESARG